MKIRFIFLVLAFYFFSIFSISVWALEKGVCYPAPGGGSRLICRAGTMPNISYTGDVGLYGTIVLGETAVNGDLRAKGATLNTVVVRGEGSFSNTTASHQVNFSGNLKTNDNTQIQGHITVAGGLSASQSNFNVASVQGDLTAVQSSFLQLGVDGDVNATETKFLDSTEIKGRLTAIDSLFLKATEVWGDVLVSSSDFENELTLMTDKAVFKRTSTQSVINKLDDQKEKNIYLQDGTVVNGSIIFKYGIAQHNIVHRLSGSIITGEVINGVVKD